LLPRAGQQHGSNTLPLSPVGASDSGPDNTVSDMLPCMRARAVKIPVRWTDISYHGLRIVLVLDLRVTGSVYNVRTTGKIE
jgi:hypothetical protein